MIIRLKTEVLRIAGQMSFEEICVGDCAAADQMCFCPTA